MMAGLIIVSHSGPAFERDPARTFRQNVRDMMDEIAEWGEADVQRRIAAIGPLGIRTGRTRSRYVGRTHALIGKRWAVTAVVSPSTEGLGRSEAIGVMAAASAIEGRHRVIRASARALRRFRARMQAELLEGY